MYKLYGHFNDGEFTITDIAKVKEEQCYIDHVLIHKISQGLNLYFKYFDTYEELETWLKNSSFLVTNLACQMNRIKK